MIKLRWIMLLLCALGCAAPAAASLRVGSTQKIDFVRDLPNAAPFEYDGQYFDLGYIYTANRGPRGSGFVLYHDDNYVRLDSAGLADVTTALGEDPTKGYVPPISGGYTSVDDSGSTTSAPIAAPRTASAPSRSGGAGAIGFFSAVIFAVIIGFFRFFLRMSLWGGYGPWWGRRQPSTRDMSDPFESRVNARIAEIENEQARAGGYATPQGFGRREI